MRSKVIERILAKTPAEVTIFVNLYAALVVKVSAILKEKGLTQKALAERLDKNPSEIHKWLSGDHNFTLRSIAKLEAELGETLLEVPKKATAKVYTSNKGAVIYKMKVARNANTTTRNINWGYEQDFHSTKKLAHAAN